MFDNYKYTTTRTYLKSLIINQNKSFLLLFSTNNN